MKYFCLVLHSHIPYVKKAGVWPFGEEWVLEGMLETYIPLAAMIDEFGKHGRKIKITLGITPVLAEQLSDDYFKIRFEEYANDKIKRARSDAQRFSKSRQVRQESLAIFYEKLFARRLKYFLKISGDLTKKFSALQDDGAIEIITSAATHAYLPLLKRDSSVYAQIKTGIENYKKHFGREPHGMWLPECAYRPGYFSDGNRYKKALDEFLSELGIKYFFVDSHALEGGPTSHYSNSEIQAIKVPNGNTTLFPYLLKSGVSVLGRNRRAGMLVWSSEVGYPGEGCYREFHKKDSISGLQYWRITSKKSDLGSKELYEPESAVACLQRHAEHFSGVISDDLKNSGDSSVIVAPYDTELYGHWWFEGIDWLKLALEKISSSGVFVVPVNEYLVKHPASMTVEIQESSWGDGGGHYVWYNKETRWMWEIIHRCELRMEKLVSDYGDKISENDVRKKILIQAAREKLLLESSDWPFLVTTGQAREYGEKRFLSHYNRFLTLSKMFYEDNISREDEQVLSGISATDSLFPDIDTSYFAARE